MTATTSLPGAGDDSSAGSHGATAIGGGVWVAGTRATAGLMTERVGST